MNYSKNDSHLYQQINELEELEELKSSRSSYIRENYVYKNENTSLARGKNKEDNRVLIKEYDLSNIGFQNLTQIERRQEAFKQTIESNLKIGDEHDFRLTRLIDAFYVNNSKGNKCYLITKDISNSISLEEYLVRNKAMTAKYIREVIRQVLQSLHFLHGFCPVNFNKELSKGLVHGNINLNTLFIKYSNVPSVITDERQFYIYLTDFALWENLFLSHDKIAKIKKELGSEKEDLNKLAVVAFQLAGGTLSSDTLRPADFTSDQPWFSLQDNELKLFIQQLAGFGSSFNRAEEAYDALKQLAEPKHQLPVKILESPVLPVNEQENTDQNFHLSKLPLLIKILLSIAIASLTVWLICHLFNFMFYQSRNQAQINTTSPPKGETNNNCEKNNNRCIITVQNINILQGKIGLFTDYPEIRVSRLQPSAPEADNTNYTKSLFEVLKKRIGNKNLDFKVQEINDINDFLYKSSYTKTTNFALTQLPIKEDKLPPGLFPSELIGYDALVVIVAFNDASAGTVAESLKGKIQLKDLKKVYTTNKIEDKKIGDSKIETYYPTDKNTIEIFKKLALSGVNKNELKIFQEESNNQLKKQEQYETLLEKYEKYNKQSPKRNDLQNKITKPKPPPNIFELVSKNNQDSNSVIKIGFERLSKVIGQCSVYPLALVTNDNKEIQLIKDSKGELKANDSNLDLCGDKGSYWVDGKKLEEYPLKYDIGLVSQETNSEIRKTFADILNTDEGQYLLSKIGLFPKRPIEEVRNIRWQK